MVSSKNYYIRAQSIGWLRKQYIYRLCVYGNGKFVANIGFYDKLNNLCGIKLDRLMHYRKLGLTFKKLYRFQWLLNSLIAGGFANNNESYLYNKHHFVPKGHTSAFLDRRNSRFQKRIKVKYFV